MNSFVANDYQIEVIFKLNDVSYRLTETLCVLLYSVLDFIQEHKTI